MLECSSRDAFDTEVVPEPTHRKQRKASTRAAFDVSTTTVVAEFVAGSSGAQLTDASKENASDIDSVTGSDHRKPKRASTLATFKDNISKMRAVAAMFADRSPSSTLEATSQNSPDTEPVIQSAIRSPKRTATLASLSGSVSHMRAAAAAMSKVSKVVRVFKDSGRRNSSDGGRRNSSDGGRRNSSDGGRHNSSEAGPNRRMSAEAAETGQRSPKRNRRASDTVRKKSIEKPSTLADVSERHRANSVGPKGSIQLRAGKHSTVSSSGFADLLLRRQLMSIAKAKYSKLAVSEESESPSRRKLCDIGMAVHSAVKQMIVRKHVVSSFFSACCSQEVKRKVRTIISELQWSAALDKALMRSSLDKATQDLGELRKALQCRVAQHGEAWELMSLVDTMKQDLVDQIQAAGRLFRCYQGLKACETYLADDPKDMWRRLFQANAVVTGVERQWIRLQGVMSYTGMPKVKCSSGCEPRLAANPQEYINSLPGRAIALHLPESIVWKLREDLRRSGTNNDKAQSRCCSELSRAGLEDKEQISMVVHFLCNQVWDEIVFEALYCLTNMRTQATDELRSYLVELENLLERDHPNSKPLQRPATPPVRKSDPSQATGLREIIDDEDDVYDDEDDESSGFGSDTEEPPATRDDSHYVIFNAEATAGNPSSSADDSNLRPSSGNRHPSAGLSDIATDTSVVAIETMDGDSSRHPSMGSRRLSVGQKGPSSKRPSSLHGNELPEMSAAFSELPEISAALELANVSRRPSIDGTHPSVCSRRPSMNPSTSTSVGTIMPEASGCRRPSIDRSISAPSMILNTSFLEQLKTAPESEVSPQTASPSWDAMPGQFLKNAAISDAPLHDAAPSEPTSDALALQTGPCAAVSEFHLHESPPEALSSHAQQHAAASEVLLPYALPSQDAWLGQVRQVATLSQMPLHDENQFSEPLSPRASKNGMVSDVPLLVEAPSPDASSLQGRHTTTVPATYQHNLAPSSDALPLEARQAATIPRVFLHPLSDPSSAQDSTCAVSSRLPFLAAAPSSGAFSLQGKHTTRLTAMSRRAVAPSADSLPLQARQAAMIPEQHCQDDPQTNVMTGLDTVDAWFSRSTPSKHGLDQNVSAESSCLEVIGLRPQFQAGIMKQSGPDPVQESVLPSFVAPLEDPTPYPSCSASYRAVSPQTGAHLDLGVGSGTPRRPSSRRSVSPSPEEKMMPAQDEFTGHLCQRWRQVHDQKQRGVGRSGASLCWYSRPRQRGILDGSGSRHTWGDNGNARKRPVFLVADALITASANSGSSRSFVNRTPSSTCGSPKSEAQSECLRRGKTYRIAQTPTVLLLPVLVGSSQCVTARSSVVSRTSIGARQTY